ncbi:MAG: hypothetical protein QF921_03035 [Pseudomonadales bacterium]|jgi:hypothetical protein|nr:hypothetical protein [Pseudomonadales bacterium]MDP6471212.1 hypothetical protein [Pseudomonadales bacterium]MDP6825599.1 hypothetical protein [Pseudomonadales bacterium]MDP6970484.1 hypothetical protein [Pseudomonadales bacterium]|tara:strand:+ start:139 stop:291 length:153 start_codon:yes stop_codon:yes gene_type:complete
MDYLVRLPFEVVPGRLDVDALVQMGVAAGSVLIRWMWSNESSSTDTAIPL